MSSTACRVLSNLHFSNSASRDDETFSGMHDGSGSGAHDGSGSGVHDGSGSKGSMHDGSGSSGSKGSIMCKKEESESNGRVELAALGQARGTAQEPFVIDDDDDDDAAVDLNADSKAGAR